MADKKIKNKCGCCKEKDPKRLNKVGGQAVLDGVMMKAGKRVVTTVRRADGSLAVHSSTFSSVRNDKKILNIPILRGVINFVEMLKLSYTTLSIAADEIDLDDGKGKAENTNKKEKKEGEVSKTTTAIMAVGMVLGLILSLVLFFFLPSLIADGITALVRLWGGDVLPTWRAVIEGAAKIGIFVAYLSLVALMPDIKRTFMYHGAEHKSIACFESGEELTPENAMKYTRLHPRCGTSFMFVMILLGIVVGIVINNLFPEANSILLAFIRILILPLVMGLGYEFIMLAGKHDNFLTRALSAPGLLMQRITTREPTEDMLEVAITSIKCALRDDFPEFMEFFKNREWEPREKRLPAERAICLNSYLKENARAPITKTEISLSEAEAYLREAGIECARAEARRLFLHYDVSLTEADAVGQDPVSDNPELIRALSQRMNRVPLQHLLGHVYFYREKYAVSGACLIPREDTEVLVDYAVKHMPSDARLLDICTGSGCIAISTLKNTDGTTAVAIDLSKEAIGIAKHNALENEVYDRVEFRVCDALTTIVEGKFDAILANPPYVTMKAYRELAPELYYEPADALVGIGEDGCGFYEILTQYYRHSLKEGGFIAYEIGYDQAQAVKKIATEHGMSCEIIKDLSGNDRVAVLKP